MLPQRKTFHLHRGRLSIPGARYFLTVCTQRREPVFTQPVVARRALAALRTLEADHNIGLLAATLMPDHAHLLFTLGPTFTLGQTMAKFKNLARNRGREPWRWLDDGFEHRLRPDELAEDYAFYIFMNPYRARLVAMAGVWPWWLCPNAAHFRFLTHLHPDGTPPHEWLDQVEATARRIIIA